MAIVADRVKETSTTTGTGNFTLSGAATGFRTFSTAIGVNVETFYSIAAQTPGEWEVGQGYLTNSTTLVREIVYSSSNSGALVNFSSGTKDVVCTFPAIQFADKGTRWAFIAALARN